LTAIFEKAFMVILPLFLTFTRNLLTQLILSFRTSVVGNNFLISYRLGLRVDFSAFDLPKIISVGIIIRTVIPQSNLTHINFPSPHNSRRVRKWKI